MIFSGTDMFEGDSTFSQGLKSGANGALYARVYCTSGMLTKSPYILKSVYATGVGMWYGAASLTGFGDSWTGLIGIASGAIASGCMGWAQIRGVVENATSPTSVDFVGSIGHAIYWGGASGLGCTTSVYTGDPTEVGMLIAGSSDATATNVATILLTAQEKALSI